MSHTSEVSNILFADIPALQATIAELNSIGIKCSLEKGGTPRAYYSNQEGMGPADYVIRLQEAPYDIGLYKVAGKNAYAARTDLFMGHVSKILGVKAGKPGETPQQLALGKLYQTYAIQAATRKAVAQGNTVQRVHNADGSVRLIIGGFK